MQHIHLQVQDNHMQKLMLILGNLKNVMIKKIQIDNENDKQALINLQKSSMASTWNNESSNFFVMLFYNSCGNP